MTADFPIPAGYALVPLEPTEAMVVAGAGTRGMKAIDDSPVAKLVEALKFYADGCHQVTLTNIPRKSGFDWDTERQKLNDKGFFMAAEHSNGSEHFVEDGSVAAEAFVTLSPATDPAAVVGVEASERNRFEAKFPMPAGVEWIGDGYEVKDSYANSYACDRFVAKWVAWIAAKQDSATPSQALPVADQKPAWFAVNTPGADFDVSFALSMEEALQLNDGDPDAMAQITPLYAGSPPTAREPLTEDEISDIVDVLEQAPTSLAHAKHDDIVALVRAVESALGIVTAPTGGAE